MSLTRSLLGLAFASADLLVEVDADGRISLALGAPPGGGAPEALKGSSLATLFVPAEESRIRKALVLTRTGRGQPLKGDVRCGDRVRAATLRLFALPELAPAISCAISYDGPPRPFDAPASAAGCAAMTDGAGLLDQARGLLQRLSPEERSQLSVAFVDLPGAGPAMTGDKGEALLDAVGRLLNSATSGGLSAARLDDERYALIGRTEALATLTDDLRGVMADHNVYIQPRTTTAPTPPNADPLATLRALRLTLDEFLKDTGRADPGMTFSASLMRTVKEGDRLRALIRERAFDLHYQPIVDLGTGAVHHFEALTRFSEDASPARAIRMAEELALVTDLDLGVVEKAVRKMRSSGGGLLRIAVNTSAASLETDAYVQAVLSMTADQPDLRRRLMIEVTETAALNDMAAAERRLKTLRTAGVQICIDDFGAGSASFDYLRSLSVDVVKIDGVFVRGLGEEGRERTLIRHLVELCGDLNIATIAEMVETEDVAEALRALGVKYAQGYLYGRPEKEPRTRVGQSVRRRAGATEDWS
ncbi:EAL domain-containing protein [Brevundimonas sp.]|uniref:EAL domain-containing protein n=1 Tax=Brevundimonas sp. TaxID=1871086 RepID=UPI003919B1C7